MSKNIIFIGGSSRSGSTFLDNYLGQFKNVISLGELRHIMQRSFLWNEYCSCGKFFSECDFWRPIAQEFLKKYDPKEILNLKKELESPSSYFKFLLTQKIDEKKLKKYQEAYRFILDLIFEKTEAEYIVDSSKVAFFAYHIYNDSPYNIHYIHVTREAEGVIYSMTKKKKRPEKNPNTPESPEYMRKMPKPLGFIYWAVRNMESVYFSKYFKNRYFLDYKELGNEELMKNIIEKIGITPEFEEKEFHLISGNPSRFNKDFVKFRYDDKWKNNLNILEKIFYSSISKPFDIILNSKNEETKKLLFKDQ
ncbi:MAG: sulfotransferase [Epsilonproteobacteria bacterium]|nr:sulfotransferase [Campylobacterota bacterium]